MIEIVMTFCLIAAPSDCRKERIAFEGSLLACATAGQFAAAEWIATHPRWRVSEWRCGPVTRET
jgi:hypothetical protein